MSKQTKEALRLGLITLHNYGHYDLFNFIRLASYINVFLVKITFNHMLAIRLRNVILSIEKRGHRYSQDLHEIQQHRRRQLISDD